jgi:hypothetical protein
VSKSKSKLAARISRSSSSEALVISCHAGTVPRSPKCDRGDDDMRRGDRSAAATPLAGRSSPGSSVRFAVAVRTGSRNRHTRSVKSLRCRAIAGSLLSGTRNPSNVSALTSIVPAEAYDSDAFLRFPNCFFGKDAKCSRHSKHPGQWNVSIANVHPTRRKPYQPFTPPIYAWNPCCWNALRTWHVSSKL